MPTASRLAGISSMSLGGVTVEPGLLQLRGPGGSLTLERQVMAVLVELVRHADRPVSRDQLAASCWNHLVSEDALNRSVAKLRAALEAAAGDRVRVETIRGVGYRLHVAAAALVPAEMTVIPAVDLEARALAAMFEGTSIGTRTAVRYLEQATSERPDSAPLWGSLAMARILSLPYESGDAALGAALAREAALRAQALSPGEGRSLAALASLEPTYRNWAAKRDLLDRMLAAVNPALIPLLFQQVLFLVHSGQIGRALPILERIVAAAPLVPWLQSALAYAKAAIGRTADALAVSTSAIGRWPDHRLTWFTHVYSSITAGLVSNVLRLTRDGARPDDVGAVEFQLVQTLAGALTTSRADPVTGLIAQVADGDVDQSLLEQMIVAAGVLNQADICLGLLDRLYGSSVPTARPSVIFPKIGLVHPDERNTAILFIAPLQALRSDSRWAGILRRVGLPSPSGHAEGDHGILD